VHFAIIPDVDAREFGAPRTESVRAARDRSRRIDGSDIEMSCKNSFLVGRGRSQYNLVCIVH
jgi:hypothetical protein